MGQYYRPVLLDGESKRIISTISSWDIDCGAKLMEHSYLRNSLVNVVCNEINRLTAEGKKVRLVWAGDYGTAAEEEYAKEYRKVATDEELKRYGDSPNLYSISKCLAAHNPDLVIKEPNMTPAVDGDFGFMVNETKGLYVDMYELVNADGWTVHPLPLLTCGYGCNGQGGGDYAGTNMELVGSWCGDIISFRKSSDKYPFAPTDVKELKPDFVNPSELADDIKRKVALLAKMDKDTKSYPANMLVESADILTKFVSEFVTPKF